VGLLLVAVLHFVADADAVVGPLPAALPPGSHAVITHAVARPDLVAVAELYRDRTGHGHLRDREQIRALFGGWDLLAPGLADLPDWRPDAPEPEPSPAAGLFLGGVARKPPPANR
jgi:hypothetical protein